MIVRVADGSGGRKLIVLEHARGSEHRLQLRVRRSWTATALTFADIQKLR